MTKRVPSAKTTARPSARQVPPKPAAPARSGQRRTIQHDVYVYVDTVVLTINHSVPVEQAGERLEVLLMHRPGSPRTRWALPGGSIRDDETLEATARRKVKEETGIDLSSARLHQVGAFGDPGRDDRWRAISIAYMALLPHPGPINPEIHSDAAEWRAFPTLTRRNLEFDHFDIIQAARLTASRLLEDTNVALGFCNERFTMSELRSVYEAFQQGEVDPANFRRKVEAAEGFVLPLNQWRDTSLSRGRPAMLYSAGRTEQLSAPIRFAWSRPESPRSSRRN